MDKLKNGRTITIKINGNERKFKEESHISPIKNKQEIVETGPTMELDCLSEIAVSEQSQEESFDWILPEENDEIEEYFLAKQPKKKKKNNISVIRNQLLKKQHSGPLRSWFFSILLAVIIGTSFGFLVLKLVISDAQIKEAPVTTVQKELEIDKKNEVGPLQQLNLPPINTFIVQGGVFSSVDSAKIEEQKVLYKGAATQIIEENGKSILILGISDTIEKAKSIGSGLKEREIEVFSKAYTLPEKDLKNLTEEEVKFLNQVGELYLSLAALSSSGMIMEPIDESTLQNQSNFLQTIEKQEIKSPKIEKLLVELEGSVLKLDTFIIENDASLIIEAQQHLLSFMEAYFSL